MLGKLIKHEFIATWKIFLLLNIVAVVAGGFAGIVCANVPNLEHAPDALAILLSMGLIGYIFLLVAIAVLCTAYLVVRYYRSLYTSEGYLTFTLPATTTEILSAKMLVSFIWDLITTICIGISVGLFMLGLSTLMARTGGYTFGEFFGEIFEFAYDTFGFEQGIVAAGYIAESMFSMILTMMTFFFAISLGQLWQQHKILGSVIFYFVIRFVTGIITAFINVGTGTFSLLFTAGDSADFLARNMWLSLGLSVVLSIVMYFGCIFVTDRKLNLD